MSGVSPPIPPTIFFEKKIEQKTLIQGGTEVPLSGVSRTLPKTSFICQKKNQEPHVLVDQFLTNCWLR